MICLVIVAYFIIGIGLTRASFHYLLDEVPDELEAFVCVFLWPMLIVAVLMYLIGMCCTKGHK